MHRRVARVGLPASSKSDARDGEGHFVIELLCYKTRLSLNLHKFSSLHRPFPVAPLSGIACHFLDQMTDSVIVNLMMSYSWSGVSVVSVHHRGRRGEKKKKASTDRTDRTDNGKNQIRELRKGMDIGKHKGSVRQNMQVTNEGSFSVFIRAIRLIQKKTSNNHDRMSKFFRLSIAIRCGGGLCALPRSTAAPRKQLTGFYELSIASVSKSSHAKTRSRQGMALFMVSGCPEGT